MHKKLTGILALSLILSSGLNATNINAQTDVEEGFVPVSEENTDKNNFLINPTLNIDDQEEELIYKELPNVLEEGEVDAMDSEVEEVLDESAYKPQPRMRAMFAMPKEKSVAPGIGGFVNDGKNYDIYDDAYGNNKITYVNSAIGYNGDAAILGSANGRYHIVIAGVEGWISQSALNYYGINQAKSVSHYAVNNNGDLIHYLSKGPNQKNYSALNNGPAPVYLKKGKIYYSFDGHYFYSSRVRMVYNYARSSREHAINNKQPFYNYFQFLPYRAPSKLTEKNFDDFLSRNNINSKVTDKSKEVKNESMLYGESQSFTNNMNKYGANGAMTFSLAIHESGWGRSHLARNHNNLFGHNAFDSSPGSAIIYKDINESIQYHHTHFLNWHYLDYTEGNYKGGMLGNKMSGINVNYASDAYWGEKAAAHYLNLDRNSGSKDYNNWKIGAKIDDSKTNIRTEPKLNAPIVSAAKFKDQTFVIREEVQGESFNGSTLWYKIASDHLLDSNRKLLPWIKENQPNRHAKYDFNKNYVYIHSSFVHPIDNKGKSVNEPAPGVIVGEKSAPNVTDLAVLKSHMMNVRKMTDDELVKADFNGDGVINVIDLAMLKSHMEGIRSLE